jgi:hypothetical protein
VGCEEHLPFTREYQQEAVQRLKHNGSLVTSAANGRASRLCANRALIREIFCFCLQERMEV